MNSSASLTWSPALAGSVLEFWTTHSATTNHLSILRHSDPTFVTNGMYLMFATFPPITWRFSANRCPKIAVLSE